MANKVDFKTLKCGITLLAEQMPNVNSAALNCKIPLGSAYLPDEHSGAASIITDWLFRGTQSLTSRELVEKLDNLGLHRSSGVNTTHINLSAALESGKLLNALELYAQIILTPGFEQTQFELSKETSIQELISLNDEPRQKVMLKLKEQFYPKPYCNNPMGTIDTLKNLDAETARKIYLKNLDLSKIIISIAGKYDFEEITDKLEQLFSTQTQAQVPQLYPGGTGEKYKHENYDGAQLHIGLIVPAAKISSPDYYNAVTASTILGGGMSSRLFTEVREKRGLCYAIGAKYQTLKDYAGIACYAGTTPDKAQQTLDVIVNEFTNLSAGLTQDELDRAKLGLKSSLVMNSESSSARSSNLGSDFHLLGKVRSLEEIKEKIQAVTIESLTDFLNRKPLNDFTVLTIGPKQINPPSK